MAADEYGTPEVDVPPSVIKLSSAEFALYLSVMSPGNASSYVVTSMITSRASAYLAWLNENGEK